MIARRLRVSISYVLMSLLCAAAVMAAVAPEPSPRFGDLVIHDPAGRMPVIAERPADIPGFEEEAAAWQRFGVADDGRWSVHVDRRSGAPLLVQGSGFPWLQPGETGDLASLETLARDFLREHQGLFRVRESELVLDEDASNRTRGDVWIVVFRREIGGIPVEGQRFRMYVKYGRLISFGADRWGQVGDTPRARLSESDAFQVLRQYMGLSSSDTVSEIEPARQVLVPVAPAMNDEEMSGPYVGTVGRGVDYRPAWRFALRVVGEPGSWVGKVDAAGGGMLAFYDDAKYAGVEGGVYPINNGGTCPDGCEQPGIPMPWSDVSIDGGPVSTTGDMGLFTCSPAGGNAVTELSSQYVRISDNCGAVSESTVCDSDLDLGTSAGTDCDVPAGGSAGNTHAARTNFYHLNRVKEKARYYLPGNSWVEGQLNANVNIDNTCNAVYDGSVNFYKSGNGCANTGEVAGVVHHEYGHGLDGNDGGGYDNSSEAYADVVTIFQERISCVGPGFFTDGSTCSGYGDTCLTCSGIRDMDWDARTRHVPATPANFTGPDCPGGGGPCGRETHCESYVPSEAVYDLATRDLPAAGFDTASSWQLAERLWYASRAGSGGPIFNCSLPQADSCSAGSWYQQMRVQDDDDGDLSNGTPHAAALHAAFARHGIACGDGSDPENQSFSACPNLAAPVLVAEGVNGAVQLSWDPVPGAADYLVHRTELGCGYSQNVIVTVAAPAVSFTDDGVPNGLELSYRVQARGTNSTCESPVSNCETASGGALSAAGSISLDRASYGCSTTVTLTVMDANTGLSSLNATIESDTETAAETVNLAETAPGSGQYTGAIATTTGTPSTGDGFLSVTPGDTVTARYVDADDGAGGSNVERTATAAVTCTPPVISGVSVGSIDHRSAGILWTTDLAATSVVRYGESTAVDRSSGNSALTAAHDETLGGLRSCTGYYFAVESSDAAGNTALDDNSGSFYFFETLGIFSDGTRQCHRGEVTLDESVVGCSDSLPVRLVDLDLNADPESVDTVQVPVTSTTDPAGETVTLTETGPNTSVFTGSIPTGTGTATAGDGILQTADGDLLTVSYEDGDDGSGSPSLSTTTGDADCDHSGIFNLRITGMTDESAVVEWSSVEPSTAGIDWGETPALGNSASSDTPAVDHAFTLAPLPECGRFYFRVNNTDVHGNTIVADAGGEPFGANVFEIGGAVFRDEFDTETGWTLQGEWEIDEPQGLGTGNGDPESAFDGTRVLGHDLTGLGAQPGNFENGDESAISPSFNLSSLSQVEIKFRRWLNGAFGWESSIEVDNGSGWTQVWTGNAGDSSWSLRSVDITSEAAGQSDVQIRFRQRRSFGFQNFAAGWNVDRFVVRDGSQAEFAACGGCTGGPAFGGLSAVADLDPCGNSGVELSWDAAPGWGTGNGGTYAVYASTDPAFVPGPANLMSSGITGTSYVDNTSPDGVTTYYIVRAENDETCDTGPNNSGVLDDNLVRLASADATFQPSPGDIGESLRGDPANNAHVRLEWAASPDAAEYVVERADDPQGPFSEIGRTADTIFEDRDELAGGVTRYYRVTALDACGNPAP